MRKLLMRPISAKRVFLVVAIVFGGGVGLIACDQACRLRTHNANMAKAETFKREFDEHIATGTPLSSVEEFLRSKPVTVIRDMRYMGKDQRDVVGELWIEVVNERSTILGCGSESVGIVAVFTNDQHLESVRVSNWSMDCL